jgi:NAD(P)-dependent dehydrogenase (short-subunit alcohol dehydrogenase family)
VLVNNAGGFGGGRVTELPVETWRSVIDRLGNMIRRKTPTGRWGEVDDLVGPVVFLASAASDFVTGIALPVDGGYAVAERFTAE